MATYQDGNVRRATDNSITAAQRSAASRKCPKCQRGAALVYVEDIGARVCRWPGCGYSASAEALE
jgi:hypothetical protein